MFEFEFEKSLFRFEYDTPQFDPLFELLPTFRAKGPEEEDASTICCLLY